MTARLDPRKSYGTIHGHPAAKFEQDGIFYDARGELLGDGASAIGNAEKTSSAVEQAKGDASAESEFRLKVARGFLTEQLAGGPIDKAVLLKEADIANLSWEDVRRAFDALGCASIKQKNSTLWKLGEKVG